MNQNQYILRREEKENETIPQATKQQFIVLCIYIHITQATDR